MGSACGTVEITVFACEGIDSSLLLGCFFMGGTFRSIVGFVVGLVVEIGSFFVPLHDDTAAAVGGATMQRAHDK